MQTSTLALDLGCGRSPKNFFNADIVYGIDIQSLNESNIQKADLAIENIPFADNFFDYVTAHDFIEHVPRILYLPSRSNSFVGRLKDLHSPKLIQRNPFVELMNEIWRVLKPGGKFFSHTPAYPHPEVFRDPTHVNFITEHTFLLYFDDMHKWGMPYGFNGAFKVLSQEWEGPHLNTILLKPE